MRLGLIPLCIQPEVERDLQTAWRRPCIRRFRNS
jgi:hypothetical protein